MPDQSHDDMASDRLRSTFRRQFGVLELSVELPQVRSMKGGLQVDDRLKP